jgi:hypothetical protein
MDGIKDGILVPVLWLHAIRADLLTSVTCLEEQTGAGWFSAHWVADLQPIGIGCLAD